MSDHDPERLRYFESVSLVPGARALVQKGGTGGKRVTVLVEGGAEPFTLKARVARRVTVMEA